MLRNDCLSFSEISLHHSTSVSPFQRVLSPHFILQDPLEKAVEGDVFLKLDFSNAFNTVRRDYAAECVADACPQLLSFFRLCYEKSTILSFGSSIIESQEAFQQSDPLAVFFFCLCLHYKLRQIRSRFKAGYIDDVSVSDH